MNSLQNQSCSTVHVGCEIPKEPTKGERDTRTFRAKQRAQMALRLALKTGQALTDVAINTGFSGQARMTRAVRAMTGRTAEAWRGHVNWIQDARCAPVACKEDEQTVRGS